MDRLGNLRRSVASMRWWEWAMCAVLMGIATRVMVMAFVDPSSSQNPAWLTVFNWVSALCGAMCIFLCAKASVSNFAFGLVNTLVYAVYLWYWHVWGTFCLEMLVYLPFNIGSWVMWARNRDAEQPELARARRLEPWQDALVVVAVVASTVAYHAVLVRLGGNVAWYDAATLAIGIIATGLELMRYREQYVLWLVTDVVAVMMFAKMADPVYAAKKSVYLIMAFVGLYNWWRLQKRNEANT